MALRAKKPKKFLDSYIHTYLKEEIQQESLPRNLPGFARFLTAASFSQANVLNIASLSRECSVKRKTVESYFSILRDTLLSYELEPWTKRAKRETVKSPKFYFFDAGVFQNLRPRGPLDSDQETNGAALETLVLQEIKARNNYGDWDYKIFYWRTKDQKNEVDFILYGKRGFKAVEVKLSSRVGDRDCRGLLSFLKDYPTAEPFLLYTGRKSYTFKNIRILPVESFLKKMPDFI